MFAEWQATTIEEGASDEQQVSVPGRPASMAGGEPVRYRTTFDDPRDPEDDVAVLELSGLYAHGEVEVTGRRLFGEWPATNETYFSPLRIPFVPEAAEGNELVVTCHPPRDRFGGIHDSDILSPEESVPGIWWDASLSARPLPYVESLRVKPEVTDEGTHLTVTPTVVTDEAIETRVTYSLKPEGDLQTRGMMQRGAIEAAGPGRTTAQHTVDVHDPSLWWPREYGNQNRYALDAKLENHEYTVTTGICDVEYDDGTLRVNDREVPIRGVNLLTADPADIDRAIDVNANLVRAHAHVLPPAVYEACDREGILVWQDLPLTGPGEFDPERGHDIANTLVDEYAHHPSLTLYGVHDDPLELVPDNLGSGLLDRLRLRYRAWRAAYDDTGAKRVGTPLEEHRPTIPVVGPPGIDPDAGSYYPGWKFGSAGDIDSLLARYPVPIVAEYGAGTRPAEGDRDSLYESERYERFSERSDPREASQRHQSNVLRRITESLRGDGVGAIAFCLRDTERLGMGIYDENGNPKPARDALKNAFEPLQAFLVGEDATAGEVVIVNDGLAGSVTLEWNANGKQGSESLTLNARSRSSPEPIPLPDDSDTVELSLTADGTTVENRYELDG